MDIEEMVALSREAQGKFGEFTQERVDAAVRAVGKLVFDQAAPLAKMAVEETRMGVYEDKVKKNLGKARIIWHSLKGKRSVGVLDDRSEPGIVKIAKPKGVVAAVTPCTNPVVTPMFNAMIALKGGNSIIFAPHPRARRCARRLVDLFNAELARLGAPENLVQTVDEPSNELTAELMRAGDVVVATGGMGMVRAAYSSGKPAYGVGVGNVQCIVDRGYSLDLCIPKIVEGRAFDNGIICSGEQTIICHRDDYPAMTKTLAANKVYFTADRAETARVRDALFPGGVMAKDLVGQSAAAVAAAAGIGIPEGTRALAVEAEGVGRADLLSKEKMCPVLSTYRYESFAEAVAIANANLAIEGRGHSISLHTDRGENAEYAGIHIPVCRVLVNQICSTMNGGSFLNSLTPTTTLGCGSWGNNSISENLGFKHLINVIRVAHPLDDAKVPADDEIWG
ncbi:MAG: aldehyde dehydrogenase family protein [Planctomycetota bacterium]|jgi:succinate-semialdehyde dehydrogenase|nr:aldehyde dehydrogenase family protein [Planctomycetota bacterium]